MKNNYFYDLWNGDYLIIEKIEKTFDGPDLDVLCYVENEKGNKVQKKETHSIHPEQSGKSRVSIPKNRTTSQLQRNKWLQRSKYSKAVFVNSRVVNC